MARLIDADKLEKSLQLSITSWGRSNAPVIVRTYKDVLSRLEHAPTVDAVEVVRCKDCKHCLVTSSNSGGAAVCNRALPTRPLQDYFISGIGFFARVNPDDYCSHGERRTDD